MLKLMIIDDEKLIREGLVTYIEWDSLGIEVCGTCSNAVVALKAMEQIRPDIILSDIRMPEMDGIELLKTVKSLGYYCEVIFISAYRDFDYAREAIKYGAFDYLLKPIEEEVLTETVKRCVSAILKKKEALSAERSKEADRKDRMVYLLRAITGEYSWTDISGKIGVSGNSGATLAVVRLQDMETGGISETDAEELCHSLRIFDDSGELIAVKTAEYEVLVFNFGGKQPALASSLKDLNLRMMTMELSRVIGISFSENTVDPRLLYSEASWAMLGFELGVCRKVSSFEEIRIYTDKFKKKPPKAVDFISFIKAADHTGLTHLLGDFFLSMDGGKVVYNADLVKLEVFRLYDDIFQGFQNYPVWNEFEQMGDIHGFRKTLSSQKSVYSVYLVARNILNNILSLINSRQFNSTSRLINSVVNLIQKDLASEITLENVAKQLFVNPNYLSRVFSKEMSESFTQYRTKIRMERAKELLSGSNYRIYEIASMVGYSDVAHFTKVFSALAGISPSEYRAGR